MTGMVRTPVWQYKSFHEWVKTVLISDIVKKDDRVCQLFADNGNDLGKFGRSGVREVVILDDEAQLELARKGWEERNKPFPCAFVAEPVSGPQWAAKALAAGAAPGERFDAIFSNQVLQRVFSSAPALEQFLRQAAAALKPGGVLFGVAPDSAHMWTLAQKALLKAVLAAEEAGEVPAMDSLAAVIRGELFELSFDRSLDAFAPFATQFSLTLEASAGDKEYNPHGDGSLVHYATLLDSAMRHNFLFIEANNFLEFYEDHKRNHHAPLRRCGVIGGRVTGIDPAQAALIALFSTFVFVKSSSDDAE